jgi:hypothetical protein
MPTTPALLLLLLLLRLPLLLRKNGLVMPTAAGGEDPAQGPGDSPPFLLVMLLQLLSAPLLLRLAVAIWRSALAGFLQPVNQRHIQQYIHP